MYVVIPFDICGAYTKTNLLAHDCYFVTMSIFGIYPLNRAHIFNYPSFYQIHFYMHVCYSWIIHIDCIPLCICIYTLENSKYYKFAVYASYTRYLPVIHLTIKDKWNAKNIIQVLSKMCEQINMTDFSLRFMIWIYCITRFSGQKMIKSYDISDCSLSKLRNNCWLKYCQQ